MMVHPIPKEYTHDARLMTLYNTGFKEGYYRTEIMDTRQVLSDPERLVYAQGLTAGRKKREECDA